MRKILLLTVLSAGVPAVGFAEAKTPPAADSLAKGLVAHWSFENIEGNVLVDETGRYRGSVHGAEKSRHGVCGESLLFSESEDDNVELSDPPRLDDTNQLTIAAVVRVRRLRPADGKNRANSRNGILGSDDSNLIFGLTDRGRLFFVWDAAENKYQTILVDREAAVGEGQWCHLAVTRNGPVARLYVNGLLQRTERGLDPGNFVPTGTWRIGRVNGTPKRDFDGWIDDVRVYRRALSAEEIAQLAAACRLHGKPLERPLGSLGLERVPYRNQSLVVDLGVGLWAQPLPMDFDGDGDWDLVVSCADTPYRGVYLFENPGGARMPVFLPAVRLGVGRGNVDVSHTAGGPRVLGPAVEYVDFRRNIWNAPRKLPLPSNICGTKKIRTRQWRLADYNGDGTLDLLVGEGDWADYGWDNAFDPQGRWTRGPLHGYVFVALGRSTGEEMKFDDPFQLTAEGKPVDVFGMPSPNLGDFDGDGDLDLLCGEFVDSFTYFENVGTRSRPKFRAGRKLQIDGRPMRVDLCMHLDTALDWDGDGDLDLVVGQEDGRVMLFEHLGTGNDGLPRFAPARFFRQQARYLKFGALVTPFSVDWDGDGDEDLICGNTAGYIGFVENLDGGCPPRWAAPQLLQAEGKPIRIMAGPNGSIQGPCEAKWGYTTLSVADWDHDGRLDVVANSIWGKVVWFRNTGTRGSPKLSPPQPVRVAWEGTPPKPAWNWWNPEPHELATQWRTTPLVIDWDRDGLNDLVMLDHQGYLAWFQRTRRNGELVLLPGKRIFADRRGQPLRLNAKTAGGSGRRKLCLVDWDGDGLLDLLVNSRSIDFYRGLGRAGGTYRFENQGPVDTRRLAGHTTSPTVVDWDRNGVPDLLVGAEDGHFYYMRNPRATGEGKNSSKSSLAIASGTGSEHAAHRAQGR